MTRVFAIPMLAVLMAFSGGPCRQDDHGETRERGQSPDGTRIGRGDDCSIAVRFGVHATDSNGLDLGTIWSSASPPAATDAWFSIDQFIQGTGELLTEHIGPYAGTLTITWESGGAPLAPTTTATNGLPKPSFEVRGRDRADLDSNAASENRRWQRAGRAFRFAPGPVGSTTTARAVARWSTDEREACEVEGLFNIRWVRVTPLANLGKPPIPDPYPPHGELGHDRTMRRYTRTIEERLHAFAVTPVRYAWSTVTTNCCRPARYQVIQFARAVRKSDAVAWMNRTRPWGLDITESEKERVRAGEQFDPTFTDRPARAGETLLDNAGRRTPSHWDAPGMTDVRYRQMLLTPGHHEFHQQFFSFLVCDRPDGRYEADEILDRTEVVKAVIYEVKWVFDGSVTDPDRATVSSRVVATRDFECAQLGRVLAANRLLAAFADPGSSELGESADFEAELQDIQSLGTIQAP